MRIYNQKNDKTFDSITIYLTIEEARELHDDLNSLIKHPQGNHVHVSSNDFQYELTVCIYDKDNLDLFDEKSKIVLSND